MMRLSSLFWVILAGGLGFGLYHLKQEVQSLEDELFKITRATVSEQEAVHVLNAEWSYINQPSRLQALASRHLELRPSRPTQLGATATLPVPGQKALVSTAPSAAASAPIAAAAAAPKLASQGFR